MLSIGFRINLRVYACAADLCGSERDLADKDADGHGSQGERNVAVALNWSFVSQCDVKCACPTVVTRMRKALL